jgi:hypothetical protein
MKRFTDLHEQLRAKKAVIAFGRFQPPHAGHSALIKHIHSFPGDKHIYVSGTHDKKENPLTSDERVSLLKKMHPEHSKSFHSAKGETGTIFRALEHAHKKGYTHVTVVGGPDRKAEYERILHTYNGKADKKGSVAFHFKSWKVEGEGKRVGEGTSGGGVSGTKMRNAALSGDKATFRKGLHPNIGDDDMHHLMNTIRTRLGHKPLNEDVVENTLRESYVSGNLFKVGDVVTYDNVNEEITNLGPNYVTTIDSNGAIHRRWLKDVKLAENAEHMTAKPKFYGNQVRFYGYTTTSLTKDIQTRFKNLINENVSKVTGDISSNLKIIMLLQSTDEMLRECANINHDNYQKLRIAFDRSAKYLDHFQALSEHCNYRDQIEDALTFFEIMEGIKTSNTNKMKAARIIADAIELPDVDKYTTPEDIVNAAAKHARTKKFSVEGWKIVGKMMNMATSVGISWNKDIFPKPTQKAIGIQ